MIFNEAGYMIVKELALTPAGSEPAFPLALRT
jgi:hypothetical protein